MPVAATNVSCAGWQQLSGMIVQIPLGQPHGGEQKNEWCNAWRVVSDVPIASEDTFGAPPFSISTNLPKLSVTKKIVESFGFGVGPTNTVDLSDFCMPAQISVFSHNSKKRLIMFAMKYGAD
jgi:hypothetical protein